MKLHNVPIVAYSEIGFSLITTKLGRPIMLDTYISNMCLNSLGQNTYTRALIEVSNNGLVEVTCKHGKGKQNSKPRHIDGVWLTKPKPNCYYRHVSKPVNVNSEASTSQPKDNKEPSVRTCRIYKKSMLFCYRICLMLLWRKIKKIEVNNETWKASNDVGSIMDDNDSEKVENVFVEYNGKHIDDLVDDARKKVKAPPKKT
ncbi:hypothetical protein Tco_1271184 [Tanacetum coccineum]